MAIFQTLTLHWQDQTYVIPADKVMGAIAVVEDVITFPEICIMMTGKPRLARLAEAYGALLRYGGITITDAEVYDALFTKGTMKKQVGDALNTLLAIMTPPSAHLTEVEAPAEGNRRTASSPRSTRQRLARPRRG